ncbi:MAG: hypothetical protein U0P81_04155 [Holophagaceae bacterium]
MSARGPSGPLQSRFEDGLRFLAAAYALREDRRDGAAATTSACDALACFMAVFEAAAARRLSDPEGRVRTLRAQCEGLLAPDQPPQAALDHALEAASLARDLAAELLPRLLSPLPRG